MGGLDESRKYKNTQHSPSVGGVVLPQCEWSGPPPVQVAVVPPTHPEQVGVGSRSHALQDGRPDHAMCG